MTQEFRREVLAARVEVALLKKVLEIIKYDAGYRAQHAAVSQALVSDGYSQDDVQAHFHLYVQEVVLPWIDQEVPRIVERIVDRLLVADHASEPA